MSKCVVQDAVASKIGYPCKSLLRSNILHRNSLKFPNKLPHLQNGRYWWGQVGCVTGKLHWHQEV